MSCVLVKHITTIIINVLVDLVFGRLLRIKSRHVVQLNLTLGISRAKLTDEVLKSLWLAFETYDQCW